MSEEAQPLNARQQAFVNAYVGGAGWNAARAARMAGYSERTARAMGAENLTKPNIRAAIDERLDEAAMAANEVLARLAEQARGSLDDFVDEDSRIDLARARDRGMMHLLKEYACEEVYEGGGRDRDPDLVRKQKIKLHDAQAALVQIGRHHGLFTDKVEQSGPGGGPLVLKWEDGSSEPEA